MLHISPVFLYTHYRNLSLLLQCIKEFLPAMKRNNHGMIVSINSMLGLMGLNGVADYSASKHALIGYMESLQMEMKRDPQNRVRMLQVHPYLVDTEMFAGCQGR